MKKPNILMILADQHRWDCLGCYGNDDILTPNIDQLAEDGVVYNNSFCSYPICTPSRYSILTGIYTHQHLGWDNHSTIPEKIPTFPKILRSEGYHTKAVGKMHFTPTYLDVGFDEMILAEQNGPGRYDDDYHRYLKKKALVDKIDLMDQELEYRIEAPSEYWKSYGAMESNLSEKDHSTTWVGDRALESIDDWDDSGNFLMVGFIKPHHPFDPPKPWSNMYDPDELSVLPDWQSDAKPDDGYFPYEELTEKQLKRVMAYYYGLISQVDFQVGNIINKLKEKGLYENTLIIYTSDHGEYMGSHHRLLKGGELYDSLVKVPLIIKYPGVDKQGLENKKKHFNSLINNIDLAPMILGQAGCQTSDNMLGIDFLEDEQGRDYIITEGLYGRDYMIRTNRYKLILKEDRQNSLFFDLKEDPQESNNLFNNSMHSKQISILKDKLLEWIFFEARSTKYLDENAPIASCENAVSIDEERRDILHSFFNSKMEDEMDE